MKRLPLRVVLIGAESTGKSTLALALADHYRAPVTGEFVREYVEALERELGPGDLGPIAEGQIALEDAPLAGSPPVVIHDTNLLSSIVYAHHYQGHCPQWIEDTFASRHYDLYLFTQPDIPWVADPGQRESPEARKVLHAIFTDALVERELPFVRIAGTPAERLDLATAAVDLAAL